MIFQFFRLVCAAVETGLKLALSETPKTGRLGTRPQGYKLFSCSTQLSTKFILLINVKMPTNVGILRFISMINTRSDRLKARSFFSCLYFIFYELLRFHIQLS